MWLRLGKHFGLGTGGGTLMTFCTAPGTIRCQLVALGLEPGLACLCLLHACATVADAHERMHTHAHAQAHTHTHTHSHTHSPRPIQVMMKYGRALVEEQDNVKRVQLAEAYMSGAELAGSNGSSMPEAYKAA